MTERVNADIRTRYRAWLSATQPELLLDEEKKSAATQEIIDALAKYFLDNETGMPVLKSVMEQVESPSAHTNDPANARTKYEQAALDQISKGTLRKIWLKEDRADVVNAAELALISPQRLTPKQTKTHAQTIIDLIRKMPPDLNHGRALEDRGSSAMQAVRDKMKEKHPFLPEKPLVGLWDYEAHYLAENVRLNILSHVRAPEDRLLIIEAAEKVLQKEAAARRRARQDESPAMSWIRNLGF